MAGCRGGKLLGQVTNEEVGAGRPGCRSCSCRPQLGRILKVNGSERFCLWDIVVFTCPSVVSVCWISSVLCVYWDRSTTSLHNN